MRSGAVNRWIGVVVAALLGASLLAVPSTTAAQTLPSDQPPVPDPVRVRIVDVPGVPAALAFQPSTVVLVPGQTVVIENDSNVQQEVEAADGSFDSGPIEPGGAFVAAIDATGSIPFATIGGPSATGRIVFGLSGLPGASSANARSAIPLLEPPAADPSDFGEHPDYGYPTSRTQLLVLPTTTATVGQVNAALASVGAVIIGGFPRFGSFGVAIPDSGDHTALLAALDQLRADPAFERRHTAGADPGEVIGDPTSGAVAPVWQGKTQTVPAPYQPEPKELGWVFARNTTPGRGDWGFLQTSLPQAWNLLDLARQRAASTGNVDTVVLDVGFDTTHPDLNLVSTDVQSVAGHGTHVAGIVGARYDNRVGSSSRGTSGVNPLARLHAVEVGGQYVGAPSVAANARVWTTIDFTGDFQKVLDQKSPTGRYPNLGVINASFGGAVFNNDGAATWAKKVKGRKCGEFSGDDTPTPTGAAAKPCLPSTLDSFRTDLEALATVYSRVLDAAYFAGVVITKAAGNDNDSFCLDAAGEVSACFDKDGNAIPGTTAQPLPAIFSNELSKARDMYSRSQFPLLVVGAADAAGQPTAFTQPPQFGIPGYTVDLLAPGSAVRSTTTADVANTPDDDRGTDFVAGANGELYGELSGTSMAAPYVAGAVGYLMAVLPQVPGETATARALRVVRAVKESALAVNATNPRLNVWDVAVRLLGLRAFADQNDASPDGSRRVIRTADGATATDTLGTLNPDGRNADLGPQRAQPDGKVDLRDVRAFRDAWLQGCADGSIAAGGAVPCPAPAEIALDGAPDHPKKDGNGDGCVRTAPAACLIGEARYSRFDLNADGWLAPNVASRVPVDPGTGAVTLGYSQLTDLQALGLALDPGEFFDGWARDDITAGTVLRSADVTLDLSQVPTGTTGIRVTAKSPAGNISTDVSISAQGRVTPGLVTVPVAAGGSKVEVSYSATRNGNRVASGTVVTGPLRFGEDTTVALCEVKLRSDGPTVLAANQSAQMRVWVDTCTPGAEPAKLAGPVTFTVTPVDPASASSPPTLGSPSAEIDAGGNARTAITAGTSAGTFRVRATTTGPAGEVVQVERLVRVVPRLEVRYRWESEVTSVDVTTSSDWPDAVPGRPDCREVPGGDGCIVNARATLTAGAPTPTVTREGTITLDTSGVTLDETVGGRAGDLSITYGWEDLITSTSSDGSRTFAFGPLPGQSVTDRPVPLDLSLDSDGSILLDGFRFLADIPYESGVVNGATTGPDIQPERFGVPGELLPLSVPQPSSVQHSASPTDVTRLRASGGSFVPVSWCGTVTTPIERTPGYRVTSQNDLIAGAVVLANDPVYAAGKIPMPAGNGSFQRRIRVTFTGALDGAAADPVLPSCTGAAAPTAAFDVAPQPDGVLHEGDAIRFLDRSTDPDGDLASWSWSFGRSDRNPVLVPGLDSGVKEVSLRVADTGGRFSRVFQNLNVTNVLPTVQPVSPLVTVQEGDRATIAVRLDDPGPDDRTKLNVRVAEGNTELVPNDVFQAGTAQLTLPVLEPGVHTVTIYVYDGNSQFFEVQASVTVVVTPEEVRQPSPERAPVVQAATCAAPVPLSADEAALLQRWNAAREQAGLPALGLSAELSRAASTLAGQSLGVLGLAPGADVGKAVTDAGYEGREVRALPFSRDLDPFDVLEGLRAAEPGTVFSTTGRMVGVAKRAEGSDVKWVVVVGGVVDCSVTPVASGVAPQLTVTPPAAPVVEGARVQLTVDASDPDGDLAEVRVDWGDGTVGGTAHRYRDDGVHSVRVTALDEQGNQTSSESLTLTVLGAAPEVDLVAGELVAGGTGTLELAAADPAQNDRPLQVTVSSVPAGAVSYRGTIDGGRTLRVQPPSGTTSLDVTVTVTDSDGLSNTVTRTFPVVASAGTPPAGPANVVAPPAPTCAPGTSGVTLRAQAADFLIQANTFRASFGASALSVSKELQAAAEQHLADLIAKRYFAHLDSAGRTPLDRARANGYTGGVGENIALRFVNGAQVLLGWRSSPVHLENLLDPVWNATGVAVGNSPDGVVWVQVFGTVPTCPTADRSSIPAPVVLANPPLDAAAPVAGWPARAGEPATAPLPAAAPVPAAGPAPAQQPPASTASVAAFTVSDLTPASGGTVVITNRSRDAGTPVSATLTFGSVSNRILGPGETFQRAVFSTQDIVLSAAGATAATSVTGAGSYVPQLSIVSPAAGASFDQGAAIAVRVLVTDSAATPSPLAGVRVRARVNPPGGEYVIGATGTDGTATLTVRPSVAGPVVLEVEAETVGGDSWVAAAGRNLTIVANTAPVFPAIDPITVELERPLRLWVPEAVDADVPVAYSWDLDGNGTFGDLGITSRDVEVSWADVSAVICGGVCTPDQAETVTIRATDAKGASTDAVVSVTPVRDFQVAVNPQRLSLPPGGSTVVAVTTPTTSGFALPIALSATGLPDGITATFLPTTITPGQVANLTLSVSPTYNGTAPIPLTVTGTATVPGRGTVVRTATPTVSVLIGLDRICTVSWSGTIRNAVTRAPVPGATVQVYGLATVTTGPDGRWSIATVPVAGNNGPQSYNITVERTGFHTWSTNATAICDANRTDIDLDVHERLFVPVKVQVRDADSPTIVPAGTVVDVSRFASDFSGPVDVDGRATALISLSGPDNRAAAVTVSATAPGYHYNSVFRSLTQDALPDGVTADIGLTKICSARFVGGTVIDADGRLVPGARVSYGGVVAIADADGRFTIDRDVALGGRNNTPVNVAANGSPPSNRPDLVAGFGTKLVDQCAPFEMTVVLPLNPNGPQRFATLQGRFLTQAGDPIPAGRLTINGLTFYGNSDGTYSARLLVGNQNAITGAEPPPAYFQVYAGTNGTDVYGFPYWWPVGFQVTLAANEVRTYDIVLDPVRYGTMTGVVVDAATGAPLANQTLDLSANGSFRVVTTGADGRFASDGLRQQQSGTTTGSASTRETADYWPGRANGPFSGDPPTVDLVVPAIRKCAPASVTGLVVENVAPNGPLEGVTVRLDTGEQAVTGADGRFSLNAGPYYENAPREVTITASKTGFVTASRRVFIFCGATLVVDFAPQSPTTGTITGLVTDSSGTPLPDVFVGTEYGGGTRTGTDGRYTLTGAPPNPDGSARTWKVSAVPGDASGLLPASVTVAVTGGQTSTADLILKARETVPVNRPPTAVISPSGATVPEGTLVTFSGASSSDPDGDPLTYSWDLDADGSVDGASATFAVQQFAPGPRTVKLTVADGKGAAASTQVVATFTNVAPTVIAGGDVTIGPDGVFARAARFEDPGQGDDFTATVDWGDGSGVVPLPRFARTLDLAHTFPAIGGYRVVVRVCDAGGGCGEGSFTVTVASEPPNLPPIARLTGPLEAIEGQTLTYDASASTDPEGRPLTFAWDLDADGAFDDGTGPVARVPAGSPRTRTIVVSVSDDAGAVSIASLQVTVRSQPTTTTTTPAPVDTTGTAVPSPPTTSFVPQPSGRLPETGTTIAGFLVLAAWLVGMGALMLAARRRSAQR